MCVDKSISEPGRACVRYLLGIALACITAGVVAEGTDENAPICGDIKRLLGPPNEFGRYRLIETSLQGSEEEYFNVDVDADDVSDVVKGGCAASQMPADPCDLSIELSAGGRHSFTFAYDERFYLARYRSQIYAVVSHSSGGASQVRSILKIDKNGITRTCVWP